MKQTRRLHARMLRVTLGVGLTTGMTLIAMLGFNPTAHAQTQLTEHTAADGAADDRFGHSVGLSGDYFVAGAYLANSPEADRGAAYVFNWDGFGWTQQQKLTGSGGAAGDWFGFAVAISGDVVVVGAPERAGGGAAYVFRRSGVVWNQEAILTAASTSRLGDSVAIEGDRVVVGDAQGAGKAFIFERILGMWTQQADLASLASPIVGDQFGWSVSISGDSVAVGARNDSILANDSGAAYVFHHNGMSWGLQATIRQDGPDANALDQFGSGVSISANRLAIGAPGDGSNAGATYVFDRSGVVWTQSAKIVGFLSAPGDAEGWSVALQGNRLASGAYQRGGSYGAVHIYQYSGGIWVEDPNSPVDDLDGFDFTNVGDELGTSVAIDDDIILAGIPGKDLEGSESGSVLFFRTEPVIGNPDTDNDGLTDADEMLLQILNGGLCPDPLNPDSDGDTISDGDENLGGTNMCAADSDGDGLNDNVEINTHGTDPNVADSDGDGVNDGAEVGNGTNPLDPDSDDDTLDDGDEVAFGTNPLVMDTDGDGLTDGQEVAIAAGSGCPNPLVSDSDGDGLPDGIEHTAPLLDPCDSDSDNDGLADGAEAGHGTDPGVADTDGDGLLDGHEVMLAGIGTCPSPTDPDSDGDGISDGDELTAGAGPCDLDSDDDGLSDANEVVFGTNPVDSDTDNDGASDGAEVDAAMGGGCPNPLDADSDNDGLNDGAEIALTTSPCNNDTDGDGLLDGDDPHPLTPDVTPAILACLTLATAGEIMDTPTSQFLGANNVVRQVRRATLASTTALAAVAISRGHFNAARALLQTVENLVDGVSPPPDWMASGPAKTTIHTDVQTLLTLLDLID